jgi:TonB family protein
MKTRFYRRILLLQKLAGIIIVTVLQATAGDVRIIANPNVKSDSISPAELKSVFLLERRTLHDGSVVSPVLQKSGAAHDAFLRQYLERGNQEIEIYYQGLVFTGKGVMPKRVSSEAEVVAFVAGTKGAIGYVSSEISTNGVKILRVTGPILTSERALVKRVEPEYPETLRAMKIGGTVRLQVTIAPNGAVEDVMLLGGNPILAEAAAKAVRQWVYSVGPSRVKTEVSITF